MDNQTATIVLIVNRLTITRKPMTTGIRPKVKDINYYKYSVNHPSSIMNHQFLKPITNI